MKFTGGRVLVACLMSIFLLAAPTVAAARAKMNRSERAVVRKVNALRAGSGLATLRTNKHLARAADAHNRDMLGADFFAHNSSNGRSAYDRGQSYRRSSLMGETLAYMPVAGDSSARKIVDMWKASPPHAQTLMLGRFRRIGGAKRRGTLFGVRVTGWTADLASAR